MGREKEDMEVSEHVLPGTLTSQGSHDEVLWMILKPKP